MQVPPYFTGMDITVNDTIEAAVDPFDLGNGDPTQAFDLRGEGEAPIDVTLPVGNNPGITRVCDSTSTPCTSLHGLFPGINFIRPDSTADNRILGRHVIR